MKIDLPIEVARDCIPSLRRAISEAEHRAELAWATDESFRLAETDYTVLDCLLHALSAAIKADEADCARKVAEAEASRLPAADTATCDGCENAYPVDEVEVMGDAEHGSFGFCRTCLAKDAQAAADCCPITGQEYGTGGA